MTFERHDPRRALVLGVKIKIERWYRRNQTKL